MLLVGYGASVLARRGRFPDLLVLIALGALLGPVNGSLLHIEGLAQAVASIPLKQVTPLFGALALSILMFDAGMDLHIREMAKGLRAAVPHTLGIFVLSAGAVAAWTWLLLGLPWLVACLLGVIVGGVSTAVVVSAIKTAPIAPATKTLVTLECVLVDVFTIAAAVTLMEALKGGSVQGGQVGGAVFITLIVSVALGAIAGVSQVALLPRLRDVGNHYILTLALLLGVYGVTEWLTGSGPIAAFAYGLVLGNSRHVHSDLRDTAPELSGEIHRFHGQATFLVRTFFFVLLGLTFSPAIADSGIASRVPGLDALPGSVILVLAVVGALVAIMLARRLVVSFTVRQPMERSLVSALVGRGLGSAVLATFPFTLPEFQDPDSPYARTLAPYQELFPSFVGIVIVLTILATTLGLMRMGRAPGTGTQRPVQPQPSWPSNRPPAPDRAVPSGQRRRMER